MIGWYIGAFSPPTIAHKVIVQLVIESGIASIIHVVPSSDHYEKPGLLSGRQRILLLQLVLGDIQQAIVDDHDFKFDHWPSIAESLELFCHSRSISLIDIAFINGSDKNDVDSGK
jgi:nicotinic acid mononucleotide adenylyltransferase